MRKKQTTLEKHLALKKDLTRALAELEVARYKIKDLKSLIHISSILNASIDSHELLSTIVKEAKKMIHAEGVGLLKCVPKANELVYESIETIKGTDAAAHARVKLNDGVVGWVAQHKKPVFSHDVSKDKRFRSSPQKDLGLKVRSVMAAPLIFRDKLLGVLKAVNVSMKDFVEQEALELFSFYANEAAVAISNAQLFSDFKILFLSTVRSLSQALEAKDSYTHGHVQRVAHFAVVIAKELGLKFPMIENVELSALLHDVGKIGVPEEILMKPSQVTSKEFEEIKKHPSHGLKILEPLEQLEKVMPGIHYHHERWDGKGYPEGLKGEEIPMIARIVCVVDALDAMTSDRPYRKALSDTEALKRLKKNAGTQFDPTVVQALLRAYKKGLIITANHQKIALSDKR